VKNFTRVALIGLEGFNIPKLLSAKIPPMPIKPSWSLVGDIGINEIKF